MEIARYADMFSAMGTEPRLRIHATAALGASNRDGRRRDSGRTRHPNSTLSHHLDKLKNEGLINVRREGTFLWHTANTEALEELLGFLYAECCTRKQGHQTGNPGGRMEIKEVVKERYGKAALRVTTGGSSCCGASSPTRIGECDPITSNLYDVSQTSGLPEDALKASLGCGNPTALAALNAGETVLEPRLGGGIDVLLSAGALDNRQSLRPRYDR